MSAGSLSVAERGGTPAGSHLVVGALLLDASHGDRFPGIMNAIIYRLQSCSGNGGFKGTTGLGGVRALSLLRMLLVSGPEYVLSAGLDLVPLLRIMSRTRLVGEDTTNTTTATSSSSSGPSSALSSFSKTGARAGAGAGPTSSKIPVLERLLRLALEVLGLLVDHRSLLVLRQTEYQRQRGWLRHMILPACMRNSNSSKDKEKDKDKDGSFVPNLGSRKLALTLTLS